ncbi:MAG: MFS transporter [Gammaproteobacteria bacterium]|nr:MFS transporter [Gammaproteobacteria bacterium]CAJ2377398.1 MAG: Major facilitator superfamily MFS_1 [Arenicellales bacterium IbO2]MDA7962392.1 MFS transporter [Gammaproteobacteria bacterium]MDA7970007.1 MFS transporter [Gammaproteobacteria bacterium]MDA7970988.1 MFS transporter [Gammaproteobacteria bacterium]
MKKIITTYFDRRMAFIFFNGAASGFPWVVIGSAMTLWLKDLGLTRTAIGFFGSVFAVYSLNWMWAPLLDRVRLPLLARLGQRRSWLLLLQALMLLLILAMSRFDAGGSLVFLSLLALSVASVSATQDVVIDAYRIDVLARGETDKLPAGAALATAGWWSGYGFIGAAALYFSDFGMSWNGVYVFLAMCVPLFMLNTLLLREPRSARFEAQREIQDAYENMLGGGGGHMWRRFAAWCLTTLFQPIRDFFSRFGAVALLIFLFIVFFKIGEAFLGRMSLLFYKEIGFTSAEIATYSKLVGSTLTIAFSIVAGAITVHFGLVRGLMVGGISMAATNLIFAYMAATGPDTTVFATAIFLDNFTSAFSTVAFVAFISHLTSRTYSASQYALMASLGNFGRTLFAGGSGWLVDSLDGDWVVFFVITALMVAPSLLMLYWIAKKLRGMFA